MLIGVIDNIKDKPEIVRRRIAFYVSLFIAIIIFTFWFASKGNLSLSLMYPNTESQVDVQSVRKDKSGVFDTLRSMTSAVSDGASVVIYSIKEGLHLTKEMDFDKIEVLPGSKIKY